MRGYIFTLDAILAALAALVMITAIYFFVSGTQSADWSKVNLNSQILDSLAVLELNDDLKNAVLAGSNTTLNTFLNSMFPEPACGYIQLRNSTDSLHVHSLKTGCSRTGRDEVFIARRTFIVGEDIYYAMMEGWYE